MDAFGNWGDSNGLRPAGLRLEVRRGFIAPSDFGVETYGRSGRGRGSGGRDVLFPDDSVTAASCNLFCGFGGGGGGREGGGNSRS